MDMKKVLKDASDLVNGDDTAPVVQETSMMDLLNIIAHDTAILKSDSRAIRVEMVRLSNAVDYLTKLSETIAEEEKQVNPQGAEALEAVQAMLNNSHMSKHPMFKEMLGPLEKMIKAQKA